MKRGSVSVSVNKKRLVSSLMSTHSSAVNAGQDFHLKSNREFATRLDSVFNGLNRVEEEHERWIFRHGNKRNRSTEIDAEDSSTVFKKPGIILARKRQKKNLKPDFIKHPEKWMKYSLQDTPEHTDALNTAAAMKCLKKLRQDAEHGNNLSSSATDQKIIFHKPSKISFNETVNKHCYCACSGSRVLMPEYVVGENVQKKPKTSKISSSDMANEESETDKIKLSHLSMLEDE